MNIAEASGSRPTRLRALVADDEPELVRVVSGLLEPAWAGVGQPGLRAAADAASGEHDEPDADLPSGCQAAELTG